MTAKPMDEQMLAAKREQYRDALENAVQQIVTALAQKPEVEGAILFGSYAQGRRDLFTDLDVLIVMDSPLDFLADGRDVPGSVLPGRSGPVGLHAGRVGAQPESGFHSPGT
jgi:hypothetical protein